MRRGAGVGNRKTMLPALITPRTALVRVVLSAVSFTKRRPVSCTTQRPCDAAQN